LKRNPFRVKVLRNRSGIGCDDSDVPQISLSTIVPRASYLAYETANGAKNRFLYGLQG